MVLYLINAKEDQRFFWKEGGRKLGCEASERDGKIGRKADSLEEYFKNLREIILIDRDCVFGQNFVAFCLKFYPKKQKKKQLYRYSQSRWNTYMVVSSF